MCTKISNAGEKRTYKIAKQVDCESQIGDASVQTGFIRNANLNEKILSDVVRGEHVESEILSDGV